MFIRTRINPVPGGAKVALREGISGGKREFFPFILLLDVFENLRRSLGLRFACACRCGEPQKAIGTVMGQRRSTLHYPDPPCPQNIASGGSGGATPRQHVGKPQKRDRDCTVGFYNPILPAHRISPAGGRGVQPPVSMRSWTLPGTTPRLRLSQWRTPKTR